LSNQSIAFEPHQQSFHVLSARAGELELFCQIIAADRVAAEKEGGKDSVAQPDIGRSHMRRSGTAGAIRETFAATVALAELCLHGRWYSSLRGA
jgi:hypothetical protein